METATVKDRLRLNYNRLRRLNMQRAKNIRYGSELSDWLDEIVIDDTETLDYLSRFENRLKSCCSHAVGQISPNDPRYNVAVKTGRFCNHRLCNICNSVRAKKLRRKFFAFFNSDERNVEIKPKQYHFFQHLDKFDGLVSGKQITESFDFMHLTLTVPHKNGLWQGKEYYAKELLDLFHTMRKCAWWTKAVWGGEQCVETVQTENNLHIHIHALILVKRGLLRSRNTLMLNILKKWNELTVDYTLPAEQAKFTAERLAGLKGAVQFLRPKYFELDTAEQRVWSEKWLEGDDNDWFEKVMRDELYYLDARGSTHVGLNNLYKEVSAEFYQRSRSAKFTRDGKHYCYINPRDTKDLMKGILECLKYHFEPCSLEDENGRLNTPLLCSLLPNIYRQRLYGKFGGFYGLKQLNVTEEPLADDDMQEFTETASTESYDPTTGQPCCSSELLHVVFDLKDLRFSNDGLHYSINPQKIKFPLRARSLREALLEFISIVTDRRELKLHQEYHRYHKHFLN